MCLLKSSNMVNFLAPILWNWMTVFSPTLPEMSKLSKQTWLLKCVTNKSNCNCLIVFIFYQNKSWNYSFCSIPVPTVWYWKWNSLCEYIGLVWHQITKNNGTIVKVLWLEETIINNARINSNLRGHPTIEGAATRLLSIITQKC